MTASEANLLARAEAAEAQCTAYREILEAQRDPTFHHPGCPAFPLSSGADPDTCRCVGGSIYRFLKQPDQAAERLLARLRAAEQVCEAAAMLLLPPCEVTQSLSQLELNLAEYLNRWRSAGGQVQ